MKSILAVILLAAGCASQHVPMKDEHGCLHDPSFDCYDLCDRADLGRCPAWIGSDLLKPGVCLEECRGMGHEALHCRLYAPSCSEAYNCYSMLQ